MPSPASLYCIPSKTGARCAMVRFSSAPWVSERVSVMAKAPQIRIRKPVRQKPARDLDLRTPSGRVLPF